MTTKNAIEISSPRLYARVTPPRFRVRGTILKNIYDEFYGLDVNMYDHKGHFFQGMSPRVIVKKNLFSFFRNRFNFFFDVELNHIEGSGIFIVEVESRKGEYKLLPLIFEGANKDIFTKYTSSDFKEILDEGVKKIKYLKKRWVSYLKELDHIQQRISNRKIWNEISTILEESEENFGEIVHLDEEEERGLIDEKYRDALDWHGELLRGVAGRMNGFDFVVNSRDHIPRHFHIFHKGKGVHARFLYPEIQLYDYKGDSNEIGSKEVKRIQKYFSDSQNFEVLKAEFDRQILE